MGVASAFFFVPPRYVRPQAYSPVAPAATRSPHRKEEEIRRRRLNGRWSAVFSASHQHRRGKGKALFFSQDHIRNRIMSIHFFFLKRISHREILCPARNRQQQWPVHILGYFLSKIATAHPSGENRRCSCRFAISLYVRVGYVAEGDILDEICIKAPTNYTRMHRL